MQERERERVLACTECGAASPPGAPGWRAYLDIDDEAVTFCPECTEREFDGRGIVPNQSTNAIGGPPLRHAIQCPETT